MALWRQRGLALEQEEAGVPERGARILRLCWRAHGGLLFCVLLVVVVVVVAPRGTRLVYPSRFSLSTLLENRDQCEWDEGSENSGRTADAQFFFSPSLVPKLKTLLRHSG